jgi:hypothetical protein
MPHKDYSSLKTKLMCDIRNCPSSTSPMKDISPVLGAVTKLPPAYWEPRMFFFGAPDSELLNATGGGFPCVLVQGKTHPVFSLEPLPDHAGYMACPCSSSVQRGAEATFIRNGCILDHTGHTIDRDVYVLDQLKFPVPRAIAGRLRFKGRVPETCLRFATRKGLQYAPRGSRNSRRNL